MENKELLSIARKYYEKAYVPYSNFCVGAAVLMDDGSVHGGANVESASYGATVCAERTALVKAITESSSKKVLKVAVVGREDMLFPCGICRQFIAEFGTPEIIVERDGEPVVFSFDEILPNSFTKEDL